MFKHALLIALAALLAACAGGPQPEDRAGREPAMALEDILTGRTYAYAVFERAGVLDRMFWVEAVGRFDGEALTLEEYFLYDDGVTAERIWTFQRTSPTRYVGTAPDVIGEANIEVFGDAAYFDYVVDLVMADGSTVEVQFQDRLYRVSQNTIINRATVKKFGLVVGQVTVVFQKDRPSDWPDIPGAPAR
jgi:hypothetical protein